MSDRAFELSFVARTGGFVRCCTLSGVRCLEEVDVACTEGGSSETLATPPLEVVDHLRGGLDPPLEVVDHLGGGLARKGPLKEGPAHRK